MSVLVAAHTSAGKTVVAQYAIAKAIQNRQRVIYTSPIKALSNQKYRELESEFKDVGLMTGDVTLNPTATCIVMTTEILRNMLYKGSEVTREMAWVIFDEVHYMRDKDRGVVWEETIILLPNAVKYVFLSATIPNAHQFAQWICKIKNQPCNVVSTGFRPVPLQHYIYPTGSDGIFLVVNENGEFRDDNFSKAVSTMNDDYNITSLQKANKKKSNSPQNDIKKVISLIKAKNLNPAIVFAFSKKDCEQNALALSKIDFTTQDEKEQIEFIYTQAINTLSDEDQQLKQIMMMLPLLKLGIGIHHGGLLPIVKESVELLFQEGLLKVLFSTETFSMGINMPAKTVVFTNIEKFDGETHRWITSGEYIQMSGRAGRRGLDDRGVTIMMMNKKMDKEACKAILSGKSDPLFSSFKLSYNMIVNLMRIEGLAPDFIVRQSFRQFQSEDSVPGLISEIIKQRSLLKNIELDNQSEKTCIEIKNIQTLIDANEARIKDIVICPETIGTYLQKGRFIKVNGFGWGIVLKFEKRLMEMNPKALKQDLKRNNDPATQNSSTHKMIEGIKNLSSHTIEVIVCDVLLYVQENLDLNKNVVKASVNQQNGILGAIPVFFQSIEDISKVKIDIPNNLTEPRDLKRLEYNFIEVSRRIAEHNYFPMDPIIDLKVTHPIIPVLIEKNKIYKAKIYDLKKVLTDSNDFLTEPEISNMFINKENIRKELNVLITKLIALKETVLNDELAKRKKVLRHFDFINDETVKSKGQVACLLSSADEILLTEMLYHGQLNDYSPEELSAMLSCFLTEEREQKEAKVPENKRLAEMHKLITKNAERVAEVLIEKRLDVEKERYVGMFRPDMMEVVEAWSKGSKFSEICDLTESYEGNIIRVVRRLDELIKQVSECAQLIGNTKLREKLDKSSDLIKRGIIFAASLYLSDGK